jgi:hypothetical protein
MRTFTSATLLTLVSLLAPDRAAAGLYSTAEPPRGPQRTAQGVKPLGFSAFRDDLTTYLTIAVETQVTPSRKHYLEKSAELERKERAGSLTTEERVNLSEYLIRLGRYDRAIQLLTPVARTERRNFMVFANLGTAHQLAGQLDRALSYLEQVRDVWPSEWPGLSTDQLSWYREAEKYHLKLVRLRYRESLRQPAGRSRPPESVDDLFGNDKGPLHFVGASGRYEAGKLAAVEQEKLPRDAVALVQQLLLWVPGGAPGLEDARLYWLLGELYNAEGYTTTAIQILDRCAWTHRLAAADLREHLKIIRAFEPPPETVANTAPARPSQDQAPLLPATRQIDLRQVLLVGGLAAVAVIGLIYLQVREIRRRRK